MLSGISWPQLLIVLVIVLAIFGTKRFRSLGTDLGKGKLTLPLLRLMRVPELDAKQRMHKP